MAGPLPPLHGRREVSLGAASTSPLAASSLQRLILTFPRLEVRPSWQTQHVHTDYCDLNLKKDRIFLLHSETKSSSRPDSIGHKTIPVETSSDSRPQSPKKPRIQRTPKKKASHLGFLGRRMTDESPHTKKSGESPQ